MRKQKSQAIKRRVGVVFSPSELILIRHGVTQTSERLCGRTDVPLAEQQPSILSALRQVVAPLDQVITSPARRCVETAALLWGQGECSQDERLWEQDFGDWENQLYSDLPDIGDLEKQALARHTAPNGESFLDLCSRAEPALKAAAERAQDGSTITIVAHAGIVRSAIGLALGDPALGLGFEVAPHSITRLRCLDAGQFSIIATNWLPA